MVKYRIAHRTGEFSVDTISCGENCFALIFDHHARTKLIIRAKNEEDLYWSCRIWASSNIRGEFYFELVPATQVNAKTSVSVAA